MGLEARPVTIRTSDIRKVTPPFIIEENGFPVLIHAFRGKSYISGDGKSPLKETSLKELIKDYLTACGQFPNYQGKFSLEQSSFTY